MIDCHPLPASLSALSRPWCSQFSTFPQSWVNHWIDSQLPSDIPPNVLPPDWPPPDFLRPDSLPADWPPSDQSPPDHPRPSTPPILIDHGLQVYLWTCSTSASKCISEFTWSRPPSASPISLVCGLQVHLWGNSISVPKCISKHTRSWPPCTSSSSDGRCTEIQGYQRWNEWWGVYIWQTPE